MNKILFYIYDLFIKQPIEGFVDLYTDIRQFFRKPRNMVLLMLWANLILLFTGLIASLKGKPLPPYFFIIYAIVLLLIFMWKTIVGGDIEYRWKKHIAKKIEKIEKEKLLE